MKTWFPILVCLFLISCNQEQKPQTVEKPEWEHNARVKEYLEAHEKNNRFNGSILIAQNHEVVHEQYVGSANQELSIPITDSTLFLIGSITKPIVAAAILTLVRDQKLSLEDRLDQFFPDFPRANEVSIEQLLTHTSGIRDYHYFPDWKELSQTDIQPVDVVNQVATDPYRFDPGTGFRYSNTGYILLGLIIEQISNSSFESYVQDHVLEPMGMENSGVISNAKTPTNLAIGMTTSPRDARVADYINYNQPFTSGNMYSTTADLMKFTQAIMDSVFFSPEQTAQIFSAGSGHYGKGWGIRDFDGIGGFGHYGGMNGFWGSVTYLPESQTLICFLTNDDNTPKISITQDLVAIINDKPYILPERQTFIPYSKRTAELIEGDYLVKPGDTLHVYSDSAGHFMQETGQIPYELFQVGPTSFVMTMQEFVVHIKNDTLRFSGLVNLEAPRIKSN